MNFGQTRKQTTMITSYFKAKNSKTKARRASENDEQESSSKRTKVNEQKALSSSSSNVAVQELLSHLTEDSWREALETHLSSPGFASLAEFVASERKRYLLKIKLTRIHLLKKTASKH